MSQRASEVFRVLGVSTRLRIVELLKNEGPSPVKTISEKLGITPAAVSQHMKALRYAGLVTGERQGYWVPYAIDAEALERCCGMLIQVCTCPEPVATARGEGDDEPERARLLRRKQRLRRELQRVEDQLAVARKEKKA